MPREVLGGFLKLCYLSHDIHMLYLWIGLGSMEFVQMFTSVSGHAVMMKNQLRLCRIALFTNRIVYMASASGCKVVNHFHTYNLNDLVVVACVLVATTTLTVPRFHSLCI